MSKEFEQYRRVTGRASANLQQFAVDFVLSMEHARLAYSAIEDKSEVAKSQPDYPGDIDNLEYFCGLLSQMKVAVEQVQAVHLPASASQTAKSR